MSALCCALMHPKVISAQHPPTGGSPATAWFDGEVAIPLVDVPKHLPPKARQKLVHVATVRRWARDGVYGVRLRVFAAGTRAVATTIEEVRRFVAALNQARGLS